MDTTFMTAEEIYNLQVKTACDFCQTKTPEPILDENYIDGHRLCKECYDEYCLYRDEQDETFLSPEWRVKQYKGWQSIGFTEGRREAYEYIKANPDCTFYDLISNVTFKSKL